jgi:hypothetical protein
MGTRKQKKWNSEIKKALFLFRCRNGIDTQRGGGRARCEVKQGVVVADGFRFPYTCNINDKDTLIFTGGSGKPCFGLFVIPDMRMAELHDFVRTPTCSLDPTATIKSAGKAAFELARSLGLTRIDLTDNANKRLPNGSKFSLSVMSFLATGKTWYETFLPIQPEPDFVDTYARWRDTVMTNTWQTVFTCLQRVFPHITLDVNIDDIDIAAPGSAMTVFSRLKDAKTDFFALYGEDLIHCSGIGNIHGRTWYAQLTE